jgi:molybdopterin/thiamine biosynthesis adenylyltransferase
MDQLILKVLASYENITNVKDNSYIKIYRGRSYQFIFEFILTIEGIGIPTVMGIPSDWDRKLIDIYIGDYREIKYIPHLDNEGKLCLFDLEGVLIDKNFEGLLYQTIDRATSTLKDGFNETNKVDFIEEFEQYWGRLPDTKILKSMVANDRVIKVIKYADNQRKIIKKNNYNYADVLRKQSNYSLVASDLERDFNLYKDMKIVRNGVYVYIDSEEYIYPPDWRSKLDIEYINALLNHTSIDKNELIHCIRKCRGELVLIFSIKQPNGCHNVLGVIIKGHNIDCLFTELKLQAHTELIPCWVVRCDKQFLINRGGAFTDINNKRVLVVGCGSIGGYLVNELVKLGVCNVQVVDGDILKEENIYRHLLGMEYVKEYKSKAIADYVNKNIPNVNITSHEDNIEDAILDGSIFISEYDLIISAVGNHNVNRWINEYVHKNKIETPIVYLWNEVLGIGSHVAFIATDYKGCYECFFDNCEEGIYDRTSYCEGGQLFVRKVRGCGSSYLPYSSINSISTVIAGIEVVKYCFEDRITENFLVSLKGDNHYFQKAGLKTSSRYNNQIEGKTIIEGKKFSREDCCYCGDR